MPTYGYSRISTGRQASEDESLDVQQRAINGYAMIHRLTTDRVFVERGVSGSVPLSERKQGGELLALVRPGDVVITAKLDRMFRSALDALDILAQFKARGVSIHMVDLNGDVTTNGISKLVFAILSAVAEAERDCIRERVGQVKADQRIRGRYLGGKVPFGFIAGPDGALVPHQGQQQAIEAARTMRNDGATLRAVRDALDASGHRLSLSALHRLLAAREVV